MVALRVVTVLRAVLLAAVLRAVLLVALRDVLPTFLSVVEDLSSLGRPNTLGIANSLGSMEAVSGIVFAISFPLLSFEYLVAEPLFSVLHFPFTHIVWLPKFCEMPQKSILHV